MVHFFLVVVFVCLSVFGMVCLLWPGTLTLSYIRRGSCSSLSQNPVGAIVPHHLCLQIRASFPLLTAAFPNKNP